MSDDRPLILYVDDRADALDAFGKLMQESGINVVSATTLESAVRAIRHADLDAIICDINLDPADPSDKSGFAIAEFAAATQPGVPIIASTAFFAETQFSVQQKSLFTRIYAKGSASADDLLGRVGELRSLALEQRASVTRARHKSLKHEVHDVFLCHNSADKPIVRRLARQLRSREIKPWFDEWDLIPGRTWQEALEGAIQSIPSAAILVGKSGVGPWEDRELRVFLGEFVRRGMPVIPVLLPGCPDLPELPLFLREFTWVDMRHGLRKGELDRLIWGITGTKP
jgi:CheY-like chemotaxis protein